MRYGDDDLLRIVGEERKRSIGFGVGDNGELTAARERSLAYARGEMADVPSLPGRSSVVDTSVADAVETVLPDIMEVFVGGEDVATFVPLSEEDEPRAQEETDFVQHVVFTENEGFLTIYSAFKDALLTRTGIIHWWWEEEEKEETLAEGLSEEVAAIGQQMQPGATAETGDDGTISLKNTSLHGKVKIKAVPSEDFTVAPDTVSLRNATYCAVRDRPRIQDLIARGIDADKARELPSYVDRSNTIALERDGAGESLSTAQDGTGDLRTVEVRAHYIRLASGDGADDTGKLTLWCVVTDNEERVLLHKEEVGQIPFASFTPYIVPHRFYGESVADKLIEVQRIKTVLLRNHMDSIYFALNQRMEVAEQGSNEFTISDLLRNEPGVPIRVKTPGTISAVAAGALNVDTLATLEYAATLAESRSGIVRNAQGLNPDTLHDTAKGAMALITAAQKRVRMIARIFAEMGIRDLFVGVHCLLRSGYTDKHAPASAKLRNKWTKVSPSQWPERCAMAVHVGVGSAGREHDMMIATQRLELMERTAMMPGAQGFLIDADNIHAGLTAWERAAGSKSSDLYWSNPDGKEPPPPPPNPEMEKAKAELQLKAQTAQADQQLAQGKAQSDLQLQVGKHQADAQANEQKAQRDHELAVMKVQGELELKRQTTEAELQMKRELLTAELQMKREVAVMNAQVARETGIAKAQASGSVSDVEAGGEPG